jgi:pimeloyl-ACP methyl ester carboxylesterase
MRTASVNDIDIRYELTGQGEPLLLIHGSNIATGLWPLATALSRRAPSLCLVRYHRRGMGGSTSRDGSPGRDGPVSVGQQAADALGLLDALGLPDAHVLGYSYGATVAIETALTAPDRMRSLILLEPILTEVPGTREFFGAMAPVMSRYAAGDMAGAVTATFAGLDGENWRKLVATAGPQALDCAIRDTEVFYRAEAPSLDSWRLSPARAATMSAPVLSVVGTRSGPFFTEGRQLLHQRFPHCADVDIPGASHLLNLQAPELIAAAVSGFLQQHSPAAG